MGCAQCLPLQEPVWFSYYGPIRQPGAADAINAAIQDHLLEIGATPNIEIKKVTPSHIKVPISLENPSFEHTDSDKLRVFFSTSLPGRLSLSTPNSSETFNFLAALKQEQEFTNPNSEEMTLKFDFEVTSGVSCRIFTLKSHDNGLPIVEDDKIVIDGVISTISRVFKPSQEDGDNGFSDGLCLICCSNNATVVTFPCRHCCMCRDCAERFVGISVHCPVCRANVKELIDCTPDENETPAP